MSILWLKIIFAVLTVIFGIVALIQPQQVAKTAFLNADSANGAAEIRASWGGLFIGLGLAVLILSDPEAYLVLGLAYGGIAVVRLVNWMLNTGLINRTVIFILAFEAVSAVVFVLPEGLL